MSVVRKEQVGKGGVAPRLEKQPGGRGGSPPMFKPGGNPTLPDLFYRTFNHAL
jgi:hypothetical protein